MSQEESKTGLMRLQEKMARKEIAHQVELTQAAVRRKSVLPKSGRDGMPVRQPVKVTSLDIQTRAIPKDIKYQEEMQPTAQAESSNLESTSSRRRLAQLSINTVPVEDRFNIAREMRDSKITEGGMDGAPRLGEENAADSVAQKAKLGRRRSSLFRASDI